MHSRSLRSSWRERRDTEDSTHNTYNTQCPHATHTPHPLHTPTHPDTQHTYLGHFVDKCTGQNGRHRIVACQGCQAGRQVDLVAKDTVREAALGADCARDDDAEVDASAERERDLAGLRRERNGTA